MLRRICCFVILITVCYSCKPPVKDTDPLPDLHNTGIYVVNEGNFMSGNGGVSFFDTLTNQVTQDLFFLKNTRQAGDVCQSLNYFNNQFYLVVNNSGKIEVLNDDFVNTKTIGGLTSPRYIAFASNNKGYISDLYGKGVSVLNTLTATIEKKISINYWTEELLVFKDTLYVTSPASRYLYLIDTRTSLLRDSIDIGFGSSSITLDANNKLWILCDGNKDKSILPAMICMDPVNRGIERTIFAADYSSYASKLNFNPADKCLYWIDGDVYKLNTTITGSSKQVAISSAGNNFYGLAINQNTGDIIVSDAGDFSQRSQIYVYSKNNALKWSFKAGLISGYMLVK
ncbi:MAG: YncE family protein [Cytophaga sp.]|uniref:YncE family protein n=1 Tax=Cytophaga sp. TaxID=29535 RepID=UPI003F81205B